jgi:hypothetical protein
MLFVNISANWPQKQEVLANPVQADFCPEKTFSGFGFCLLEAELRDSAEWCEETHLEDARAVMLPRGLTSSRCACFRRCRLLLLRR